MISVIIPVLNEESCLGNLLKQLKETSSIQEVIVVDGGSTDGTVSIAESHAVEIVHSKKGRAVQMNMGARLASGSIFYFLHADSIPPTNFPLRIMEANQNGFSAGCFRLSFDHEHWLLRVLSYFTRFSFSWFHFGDQSLFVEKEVFFKLKGFDQNRIILEDQDLITRIKAGLKFKIFKESVVTSARRYLVHGIIKTQIKYTLIFIHYRMGGSAEKNYRLFKRLFKI